jgi:quercetin dioxygenase-like cupin family protein
MKNLDRRELLVALSAFAAVGSGVAEGQGGGEKVLSSPQAFQFDMLPVTHSDGGTAVTRPVLQGVLPTGESLEVHETTLQPGQMPHPAHKHKHTELALIREGTLEFFNDGKTEMVGPGGVIQTASNVVHGWKNAGETPATYFIVAIGRKEA